MSNRSVVLNDVHSALNPTAVHCVESPTSVDAVVAIVQRARAERRSISVGGARHAMGGQQFGEGTIHIDMRAMHGVHGFDDERGIITMGAGADWPKVIEATHRVQRDLRPQTEPRWGIRQKPTGADDITLGGCVSANIHGRGLLMEPFSADVEHLTIVDAEGNVVRCDRRENGVLFSLLIGGFGLFGVIVEVGLRLGPRMLMRRMVDIIDLDDAVHTAERRVAQGCIYGDFQYAIDPADDEFMRRGVLATYMPAPAGMSASDEHSDLQRKDWLHLLGLAHTDKARAFGLYSGHYVATHGRAYWSDTMQLSTYIPGYAEFVREMGACESDAPESLVIGEYDVPHGAMLEFMERARDVLRLHGVENIYGTIRLIRRDETSFMPWAREDFACTIFNLRTPHTDAGRSRTHAAFKGLTAAALEVGGSFYLTYHPRGGC
jgi:FAD/FMN-containing dehydrogenase